LYVINITEIDDESYYMRILSRKVTDKAEEEFKTFLKYKEENKLS